jgi:hypothetical protein
MDYCLELKGKTILIKQKNQVLELEILHYAF